MFLALLVPTKMDIPMYTRYQEEALSKAHEINKRFGNLHWKPVRILFEHNRVLVLSTTAGAYADLGCGALGVDPYDVEQTAEALYQAITMPAVERRERAESLRRAIRGKDLRAWFQALFNDIETHAP